MSMLTCPKTVTDKGFTLIELLIAVAILVLISAISIPTFGGYIATQNLKQAQEQVKNGLRDAQNRAISGIDSKNTTYCTTNCYWGFKVVNGESVYRIGLTSAATGAACSSLVPVQISQKLNGDATLSVAGGGSSVACVFYEISTATPTFSNLSSGKFVTVTSSSVNKCVEVNIQGMVKENDSCT